MVPICKPNEGRPRDIIILYVESGNAPLAVKVPDDIFRESSPPHTIPSEPNTVPTTDTP